MVEDTLLDLFRVIAALAFVIGLMGAGLFILKKLGVSGAKPDAQNKKRLKLVESLALDPRRRLVILQRDNKQHLVILGLNGETVIETNIDTNIEAPSEDE